VSTRPGLPAPWIARSVAELEARAGEWLSSAPLRTLVRELAGAAADTWDYPALRGWSAATLDTRRGGERREAARAEWGQDWIDPLIQAARPLGLIHTPPAQRQQYDLAVVLGGATTGNRLRAALAGEIIAAGTRVERIVGLSAERRLGDRERASEPDSVNDATEWRNLLRYLADTFGTLTPINQPSKSDGDRAWRDHLYTTSVAQPVQLLVAPSSDPQRRTNTADAIAFLTERLPSLAGSAVLVITGAIYVPYQFFAAAPGLLSADLAHVELIGTATSLAGPRPLFAQRIAQEIHAAIQSATLIACDRTRQRS
jgi:hypothetical protein